jgi:parallel beta-helix repeat protein
VQNNTIMGNAIGINSANADRGNLNWGIFLSNAATGFTVNSNFIGSNDDGAGDALEGNIIAYNQRDGIGLLENVANTVYDNRISRNSLFANQRPGAGTQGYGLGINLMTSITDGTTLNDPSGLGPNFLTNFPVTTLFGVDPTAQKIRVTGTCPSGTYVQYYTASSDANQDNAAFNEGQTYLFGRFEGGLDDEDPADGAFTFTLTFAQLAAAIGVGQNVVALSQTSESGISSTSEFSQRSTTNLAFLPVQFVSFKAELQNGKVLVSWSTATEQNASHFDVERSTNGKDFTKIGAVNARGNSNSLVNYSYSDGSPVAGISYYRLRQVDLDNRYVYTKTALVRNESMSKAFSVWPNPVIDNVNITLTADRNQNLNLRVVDLNGRVVRSQVVNVTKGMNQITVNLNTLNKGVYVVQLVGENLNRNEKLIKQ